MPNDDSFIKFNIDHNIRSQSNRDMIYFLGNPQEDIKNKSRNIFNNIIA